MPAGSTLSPAPLLRLSVGSRPGSGWGGGRACPVEGGATGSGQSHGVRSEPEIQDTQQRCVFDSDLTPCL